jgi:hypothetical protein
MQNYPPSSPKNPRPTHRRRTTAGYKGLKWRRSAEGGSRGDRTYLATSACPRPGQRAGSRTILSPTPDGFLRGGRRGGARRHAPELAAARARKAHWRPTIHRSRGGTCLPPQRREAFLAAVTRALGGMKRRHRCVAVRLHVATANQLLALHHTAATLGQLQPTSGQSYAGAGSPVLSSRPETEDTDKAHGYIAIETAAAATASCGATLPLWIFCSPLLLLAATNPKKIVGARPGSLSLASRFLQNQHSKGVALVIHEPGDRGLSAGRRARTKHGRLSEKSFL